MIHHLWIKLVDYNNQNNEIDLPFLETFFWRKPYYSPISLSVIASQLYCSSHISHLACMIVCCFKDEIIFHPSFTTTSSDRWCK